MRRTWEGAASGEAAPGGGWSGSLRDARAPAPADRGAVVRRVRDAGVQDPATAGAADDETGSRRLGRGGVRRGPAVVVGGGGQRGSLAPAVVVDGRRGGRERRGRGGRGLLPADGHGDHERDGEDERAD